MIEVSRGRGLDDLMADHERELPFLDAYASNSHEDIETQITRMLGQPDSKGWSQGVMAIDASTLTVRVTSPLCVALGGQRPPRGRVHQRPPLTGSQGGSCPNRRMDPCGRAVLGTHG